MTDINTEKGTMSISCGDLFLVDTENFKDSKVHSHLTPLGGIVSSIDQQKNTIYLSLLVTQSVSCSDAKHCPDQKESVIMIPNAHGNSTLTVINGEFIKKWVLSTEARCGKESLGYESVAPIYFLSIATSFDNFSRYATILSDRIKNLDSWPFIAVYSWIRNDLRTNSCVMDEICNKLKTKVRHEVLDGLIRSSIMRRKLLAAKQKKTVKPVSANPAKVRLYAINTEYVRPTIVRYGVLGMFVEDLRLELGDILRENIYASVGLFYSLTVPNTVLPMLDINPDYCDYLPRPGSVRDDIHLPNDLLDKHGYIPDYGIVCIGKKPLYLLVELGPETTRIAKTLGYFPKELRFCTSAGDNSRFYSVFGFKIHKGIAYKVVESLKNEFVNSTERMKSKIKNWAINEGMDSPEFMTSAIAEKKLNREGLLVPVAGNFAEAIRYAAEPLRRIDNIVQEPYPGRERPERIDPPEDHLGALERDYNEDEFDEYGEREDR
jgi:hypothetical protein